MRLGEKIHVSVTLPLLRQDIHFIMKYHLLAPAALAVAGLCAVAPVASAQSSFSPLSSSSSFSSSLFNWNSSSSSKKPEDVAPGDSEETETPLTPADNRVIWHESFDEVENPARFTHRMPEGWTSSVDGVNSGEARWKGWTTSTIRDWTWAAETDMRHWFTQAHDNLVIIDSKQQRLNDTDAMTAQLTSPSIPVAGQGDINLEFDHHYRQGKEGQNAMVQVSFDGAAPQTIASFDHDVFSKHESLPIEVPAGARSMQVTFTYANGNDDWWWAVDNVGVVKRLPEVTGKPQAIIDVLSDVQGDPEDYKEAIGLLNAMDDKAGALVLNGDLVDDGSQEQWDTFLQAQKDAPHAAGTQLWTIGNHEMYGPEGSETYLNRFLTYAGQDKPWTEIVVDGVPLISVNTEYYSDVDRGGKEPFQRLSKEQSEWLDERLNYWDEKGTPALVFSHPLLPQTVSMSHSAWYQNDFEDLEALSNVVNKYTNIVWFSAHSHSSLRQNNWWGVRRYDGTGEAGRTGFPVVNTGAILNEYLPDGDHDEKVVKEKEEASSGLRVKVFSDRVRVEAWDFKANEIIDVVDFAR